MTKVFIGGSRRISRLDAKIKLRIDRIIEKRFYIIVGDANGADKAVQEYLQSKNFDLVEVFCSGDACRNNIGHWPVRMIPVIGKRKDFSFFTAKDRAMADEASVGFMLWDRKSIGTLMNVFRLLQRRKKTLLYIAPNREFVDLKNKDDWSRLVTESSLDIRERIEREALAEFSSADDVTIPIQANLF